MENDIKNSFPSSRGSKTLFTILFLLFLLSIAATYYKYIVLRDFEVTNEPILEEGVESEY